jgi:hypothetical protein
MRPNYRLSPLRQGTKFEVVTANGKKTTVTGKVPIRERTGVVEPGDDQRNSDKHQQSLHGSPRFHVV